MLYAWDRYDRLSAVAALTLSPQRCRLGLYFRLQSTNVQADDIVACLRQLHRQVRRPIILVLDRYSVHRAAVSRLLAKGAHWLAVEWLPAYAPDLNPVEQCWNHAKYAQLPNFVPKNIDHLQTKVANAIRQQRSKQSLLRSFFKTAKLKL